MVSRPSVRKGIATLGVGVALFTGGQTSCQIGFSYYKSPEKLERKLYPNQSYELASARAGQFETTTSGNQLKSDILLGLGAIGLLGGAAVTWLGAYRLTEQETPAPLPEEAQS